MAKKNVHEKIKSRLIKKRTACYVVSKVQIVANFGSSEELSPKPIWGDNSSCRDIWDGDSFLFSDTLFLVTHL